MSNIIKITESVKSKRTTKAEKRMSDSFSPRNINNFLYDFGTKEFFVKGVRSYRTIEQLFNPIINSLRINSERHNGYNTATYTTNLIKIWKKKGESITYDKLFQELNHPKLVKSGKKSLSQIMSSFYGSLKSGDKVFGFSEFGINDQTLKELSEIYIYNLYVIKGLQGAVNEYNMKVKLSENFIVQEATKRQDVDSGIDIFIKPKNKKSFENPKMIQGKNPSMIGLQIKTINFYRGKEGTTRNSMITNIKKHRSSGYKVFFLYKTGNNFNDYRLGFEDKLIEGLTGENLHKVFI